MLGTLLASGLAWAEPRVAEIGRITVDGDKAQLSGDIEVGGELVASASELRFERLGLVIYNLDREADVSARTARGRALTSLRCAASHVIDGEDTALLPAHSTVAALANRELHAIAPAGAGAGGRRTAAQAGGAATVAPAATTTTAIPPTVTISPIAQGVTASEVPPAPAGAATITIGGTPRRQPGQRLPRLPRVPRPTAVPSEDAPSPAPAPPIELTPIEP